MYTCIYLHVYIHKYILYNLLYKVEHGYHECCYLLYRVHCSLFRYNYRRAPGTPSQQGTNYQPRDYRLYAFRHPATTTRSPYYTPRPSQTYRGPSIPSRQPAPYIRPAVHPPGRWYYTANCFQRVIVVA